MKVCGDFQSLQKECVLLKDEDYRFKENSLNSLDMDIFNPYPYPINIKHTEFPVAFYINFFSNGKREERWRLSLPDSISVINPGDTLSVNCNFNLGELADSTYMIVVSSEAGALYDAINSNFSFASVIK
jgi:hypothetical protein